MLTIRLSRVGKKKAPQYRVVVQPKTRDPWAKTTEILGNYEPHTKVLTIKKDRVEYWIKNGAQCSDSVFNLFVSNGLAEGKKIGKSHLSKKRKAKMEKEAAKK